LVAYLVALRPNGPPGEVLITRSTQLGWGNLGGQLRAVELQIAKHNGVLRQLFGDATAIEPGTRLAHLPRVCIVRGNHRLRSALRPRLGQITTNPGDYRSASTVVAS